MVENDGLLHDFIQFKLLAPSAIKKCYSTNNEEKDAQIINLEKYNLRDFSNIINIIKTLKTINGMTMKDPEHFNDNLHTFFEKNKYIEEVHDKSISMFNSRLNNKLF